MPAVLSTYVLTISSQRPLSQVQMNRVIAMTTPDGDNGAFNLRSLVIAGTPVGEFNIGALRDFFFRADAAYILDIPSTLDGERTIFAQFLTSLDPRAPPSAELQTAIVSRLLSRITRGFLRPFPTTAEVNMVTWATAEVFECACMDWTIPVVMAAPVAPAPVAPVVLRPVQDGGPLDGAAGGNAAAPVMDPVVPVSLHYVHSSVSYFLSKNFLPWRHTTGHHHLDTVLGGGAKKRSRFWCA